MSNSKHRPTPDPFDLASLRLNPSFLETAGVKKLLTTVPARRPSPQDFVRVHPAPEYRADFALIDLKDDREDYLVRPEVLPELTGEVVFKTIFTAINRQGVVFLWPVRLPAPDTSPPRSGSPALTLTGGGVVVMAGEAKTTSRSLIAISDVESVFNDEIVKEWARTLKLPADADIARFAQSIRSSAINFLKEKDKLNFPQLRTAIERLYQLNTRAEDGNDRTARALARAVDAMHADVRQWLLSCNTPHHRNIPTATEILSPLSRQSAVKRFRLILSYGGRVVAGRKRSGGRRSRSFKPLLKLPEQSKRGRPRGEAEREFVQWLALDYVVATGRPPPRTAHYDIEIRGPFSNFVHRCFELIGAPTWNVTRLLNQYGAARRRDEKRRRTADRPVT